MEELLFQNSDKKLAFIAGGLLLFFDIGIFIFVLIFDAALAAKILSMITASHLGGRLAFIALGLEYNFSVPVITVVVILYNTSYLLVVYSLFLLVMGRTQRIKVVHRYVESMKEKARKKAQALKRWNWLSLAIYVWVPLPWTGAVMGSLVAYFEGYNTRDTLLIVIPSMWFGVVCWTLWFDELYGFIEKFGKGNTLILTFLLIFSPFLYAMVRRIVKSKQTVKSEK